MRPIKLLSISLCLLLAAFLPISPATAQIKIGTNGATIQPSSLLELESANQGFLLPRMADTVAINALNPPNGMLIFLTKQPNVGLHVRKVQGWEYISGFNGGIANFNSLNVTGEVTGGTFRGPLFGNASTATTVSGNVATVNGGTGQSLYSPGDILYAGTSIRLDKLPIGLPGRVLGVNAQNMPAWLNAGAGTVINVSGIANRISVTDPTVSPVIDIASTYIGQNSITTLGTVSTGVWNGTPLTATYGGTGLNTLPLGRVLLGNGTGTVASVNGDVADLVLTSNGSGLAPTFKAPGVGDMILSVNQTVTGIKTFGGVGNVGKLVLAGNTTGTTTLNGPAVGSNGVVTLPDQGVLVSENGTQTLLNKTLNSPNLVGPILGVATGTSLSLGGGLTLITTNQTGTGNLVMSSTPTISGAILNGTTTAATITSPGTITATGGFIGTASNTSNVGALTAAAVETGVNLASNSSTTAVNTIVRRNASGDFSAGTITASLTGNASTATQLATSRNIFGHGFNGTAALTGVILGTYGGTGVDNGTRTITLGGNLTTSGANAIILTTAGATSVTLPLSGTLYGTGNDTFSSGALHTSLTDPTGTAGSSVVFSTNPTLERPIASSLLADPGATYNATATASGTFVTDAVALGTNLAGTVTITVSGGSTGTNQVLSTVTYSSAFPIASYPILYPGNASAAELGTAGTTTQVFAKGFNDRFTISSSAVGLPAGTYIWNYHVIGR